MRQNNADFIRLLNNLRGEQDAAHKALHELEQLAGSFGTDIEDTNNEENHQRTKLVATNAHAKRINDAELANLQAAELRRSIDG